MKPVLAVCIILFVKFSSQKIKSYPPIITLGKSLIERVQNHTCENAELLLKDTRRYFTMLNDLYSLILSKKREDVNKGMAVFNIVEEFGGPPHTTIEIDYKLLGEKYMWNEVNAIEDFKTVLKDTKETWRMMGDRAHRLRQGIPDPETEESPPDEAESSEGELH